MKNYSATQIRNVAIVGHSGVGKTTIAEACLHVSGASTTNNAKSATLKACLTSPRKSKYPGVSIKLIFSSNHSTGITDELIEIFLLISSGS